VKRFAVLPGLSIVLTVLAVAFDFAALFRSERLPARAATGVRPGTAIEGLIGKTNHRDVGESMNACLGKSVVREGVLSRANRYFSGWSCAAVGNPDVIFTLNHDPAKANEPPQGCRREDDSWLIGTWNNDDLKYNDIEFLSTWNEPKFVKLFCTTMRLELEALVAGRKVLLHCDAGRDRTGANTALLLALASEERGELNEKFVDAVECDYRKSKSIVQEKYGRMQNFIKEMKARGDTLVPQGGVRAFLSTTCEWSPAEVSYAALADSLMLPK